MTFEDIEYTMLDTDINYFFKIIPSVSIGEKLITVLIILIHIRIYIFETTLYTLVCRKINTFRIFGYLVSIFLGTDVFLHRELI